MILNMKFGMKGYMKGICNLHFVRGYITAGQSYYKCMQSYLMPPKHLTWKFWLSWN